MTATLYVVATPLGNLGDLSPRAAELLQHRCHDQTRPAPRRPEVDQDQSAGLLDLAVE